MSTPQITYYKYVIIETTKEKPEGIALGIFDTLEFAIDFVISILEEYDCSEDACEKAVSDLETKGYMKIDRGYHLKISKTPVYYVENRRPFSLIDESSRSNYV